MSGILPNGKQQFIDSNGNPLASGKVYYYIPSTTTFKNTYQDDALTILNTNPIQLDANGQCIAYGDGSYRQQVYDVNNNLIWDQQVDAPLSFSDFEVPAGSSYIGYQQGNSGSIARTVQSRLQDIISVFDFMTSAQIADVRAGTLTQDVTSAVQNAMNSIVASGIPSTLLFPAGSYKLSSTIVVNCGFVSMLGERSILSFATISDIPALNFQGGNDNGGNPWNQADFSFKGFTITGPSNTVGTGFYLNQLTSGSLLGPAHVAFYDFHIENFKTGIYFGNHTYLLDFSHFDIYNTTTGIWYPINDLAGNAITDSGENISFSNGTIYGTVNYSFYNQNTLAAQDFYFYAVSWDGNGLYEIYNASGDVSVVNCHFEGASQRAIYNATNAIFTLVGCYMIDNNPLGGSGTNYINNMGFMTIIGGRLAEATSTRTNIIYNGYSLCYSGMHIQSGTPVSNQIVNASGSIFNTFLPNVGNLNISGSLNAGGVFANVLGGVAQTYTLAALNTWVNLGFGPRSGMWLFRDNTSGGVAMFVGDSSGGAHSIYNGITGFNMQYNGTVIDYQIEVTSGTAPRTIAVTFVQIEAG